MLLKDNTFKTFGSNQDRLLLFIQDFNDFRTGETCFKANNIV